MTNHEQERAASGTVEPVRSEALLTNQDGLSHEAASF